MVLPGGLCPLFCKKLPRRGEECSLLPKMHTALYSQIAAFPKPPCQLTASLPRETRGGFKQARGIRVRLEEGLPKRADPPRDCITKAGRQDSLL